MVEKDIKIKGFGIKSVLKYIEENYGEEAFKNLKNKVRNELKEFLSIKIIPSEWYSFSNFVYLLEDIDKIFGTGDFKICKEIGKYNVRYELSTIHAILLKFITIEKILKTGSNLWERYFNCGNLKVEILEKGKAIVRIYNFNPISKAFCAELSGWMEEILKLAGAKSVFLNHSNCILNGKESCEFEAVWK